MYEVLNWFSKMKQHGVQFQSSTLKLVISAFIRRGIATDMHTWLQIIETDASSKGWGKYCTLISVIPTNIKHQALLVWKMRQEDIGQMAQYKQRK
jgi:hypothetical protein